jgi:hypothetical protein
MGSLSIWHWLIVIFVFTIPIPIGRLLTRSGHHWALALLYFVPIVNIVFLWIWAFSSKRDLA